MRRVLIAGIVAAAASACASAPLNGRVRQQLDTADALVRQGCYDCLLQSRDIYERAAVGKARPFVVQRLFETDVLTALRERELVLDATASFARADALLKELPAAYGAATYLAIARAIPPDPAGTPHTESRAVAWPLPRTVDAWVASLNVAAPSVFQEYLSVALDCGVVARSRATSSKRPPLAGGAPPLVQYRYGSCGAIDEDLLNGVIAAVPGFVEAKIGLARRQAVLTTATGTSTERALLTPIAQRFPQSPLVQLLFGQLEQRVGECTAALGHYAAVLAVKPAHEGALLQRTICLTYTAQSDAAVATATTIIDGNLDTLAEALYWRAFNRRELHQLPAARTDIDRAKTLLFRDNVLLLAGMIEHDQDDLHVAEVDLSTAWRLNNKQCAAVWYRGLVQLKRQAWAATADDFVLAMNCYESSVAEDQRRLADMQAADVDPHFKAMQLASLETAIKEDSGQQSASAFNAAVNFLRAGDKDKATAFADLAAKDPARLAVVEELRKLIIRRP